MTQPKRRERVWERTGGSMAFPGKLQSGWLAQATLSTEFIVLGFLGQGFYLAWDLWHLLLMNVYS